MAQNALAGLFPRGGWDFNVADARNFLMPVQQGIDAGVADYQRGLENERQNKLMQLQQDRFGLEKGRFGMDQQRFNREQTERDQTFPLELDQKRAAIAQARAATNASMGAESRAAAMHVPQLASARLQAEAAQRDFNNPVQTVDLAPDHVRVTVNKQTGQEVGRIEGPKKGPDSTSRKAIYEAQDELPNIQGSIELLNEAKQLLPGIYTGYGSGLRSSWNQGAPGALPNVVSDPKRAQATQRYNQIMNAEAINAMSQTLKGATTDNEMRAFVTIMNDPNVGPDVKARVIDQMSRAAQRHYQNKVDRIKELGGRMPDLGGQPNAAPPSRPRAVNPQTGQAVEWNGSDWVPAQ